MPDIKVKGYSGTDLAYENVEKIWLTSKSGSGRETLLAEQELEFKADDTFGYIYVLPIDIGFSVGDMLTVVVDSEKYSRTAVDAQGMAVIGNMQLLGGEDTGEPFIMVSNGTQLEGQIWSDTPTHTVAIYKGSTGAALVPFTYGELLTGVEVTPDFEKGDQHISVPDGSLVKEATIFKPAALIPENIKRGVRIAGVDGTLESGGGGGGGGSTAGDYLVKVIDYDGTVLAQSYLNKGDTFTLPTPPSHARLVFEQWVSPVEIVDNTVTVGNSPITIGATYHTASGATEIDITLTKVTGLTFSFRSYLTGKSSIDWGDGTTDNTLSHKYADYGNYTIKIYGMTAIANGSSGTSGGGIVAKQNGTVNAIYIGSSVTSIGNYAFDSFYSLSYVSFPYSIKSFGTYIFEYCYALEVFIVPPQVTSVDTRDCFNCTALREVVLPHTLEYISQYAFYMCYGLSDIVLPQKLYSIGSYAFADCFGLRTVWFTGTKLYTLDSYAFYRCYSLTSIALTSTFNITIGTYAFNSCYGLKDVTLNCGYLKSISTYAFNKNYGLRKLDLTACKTVPSLGGTNALANSNKTLQILVPSSLYDSWIAATNWSTYANYIVAV